MWDGPGGASRAGWERPGAPTRGGTPALELADAGPEPSAPPSRRPGCARRPAGRRCPVTCGFPESVDPRNWIAPDERAASSALGSGRMMRGILWDLGSVQFASHVVTLKNAKFPVQIPP